MNNVCYNLKPVLCDFKTDINGLRIENDDNGVFILLLQKFNYLQEYEFI